LAEQVTLGFFVYFTLAAFGFGLAAPERLLIVALNTLTVATMLILSHVQRVRWLASARDLFPGVIILVAYRESGLLLRPDAAHHLDCLFIQWERVLLQNEFIQAVLRTGAPGLQHYLEFVYLLCYPLVPLGLAAIYFATRRSSSGGVTGPPGRRPIDDFWGAVLLATLFCYAVYPFFPLVPPRVLFHDVPGPHIEPLLRKWNLWLLDHYSVQACIFPSGHVAAMTAVALAVRKHAPRLGALFLFLALSVAVATVYGRYHYAADAVAGALVGVAAYKVSEVFKYDPIRREKVFRNVLYHSQSEPKGRVYLSSIASVTIDNNIIQPYIQRAMAPCGNAPLGKGKALKNAPQTLAGPAN
jgi:membrane-associated phospholipid phosphatase